MDVEKVPVPDWILEVVILEDVKSEVVIDSESIEPSITSIEIVLSVSIEETTNKAPDPKVFGLFESTTKTISSVSNPP